MNTPERREVALRTNVTLSEEIAIKAHAHKCGTTVSSLLRSLVLQSAGLPPPSIVPTLPGVAKRGPGRPRKNAATVAAYAKAVKPKKGKAQKNN